MENKIWHNNLSFKSLSIPQDGDSNNIILDFRKNILIIENIAINETYPLGYTNLEINLSL